MKRKDAVWGGKRQKKRWWQSKLVVEKEGVGMLVRGGRRLSVANLSRHRTFFLHDTTIFSLFYLFFGWVHHKNIYSSLTKYQSRRSPPACHVVRATLVSLFATFQKVGKQIIFFKHSFFKI